jgi:hypothetical protein
MSLENLYFKETLKSLYKQKDSLILESLNELVSRGLLEVQETEPVLVQDCVTDTIRLSQKVKLVLKDQEYIEKLEKRNKELEDALEQIKKIFPGN